VGKPKLHSSTHNETETIMFERIKQFFKEFRVEMRKVTWPSRKEIVASTAVVLVVAFLVSFYLGLTDLLLSKLLRWMLS